MQQLEWKSPGPEAEKFVLDEAPFPIIRGPIGSGKTVSGCIKLWLMANKQQPSILDGIRYTRWAVIRNTGPQLRTTTMKTWLDWFPENQYGNMRWSPPFAHRIRVDDVDCEVLFLALDSEDDTRNLLSLELTGVFFNELREINRGVVDQALSRCGRYPSMRHGGPTWFGGFADTNAPSHTHWLPIMAGWVPPPDDMTEEDKLTVVKPEGWNFYVQPAAMTRRFEGKRLVGYDVNPDAENLENLPPTYYERQIAGRSASWILVYILNELGSIISGTPVYHATFSRETHVVQWAIKMVDDVPLRVGLDFGLSPAAIFAQRLANGRWHFIAELTASYMHAKRFAPLVKAMIEKLMPHSRHPLIITGDPKGDDSAQSDGSTAFQMFSSAGLVVTPAPTNDIAIRIEAVESLFTKLIEGLPAAVISSIGCPVLSTALESGYVYGMDAKPSKKGEAGRFTHVADAQQYCVLGGQTPAQVFNFQNVATPHVMEARPSPFAKLSRRKINPRPTVFNRRR